MNIIAPEQTLSLQEQGTEIIDQTCKNVLDDLANYTDERQHIEFFINSIDKWEDDLSKWEEYLRITLKSMDEKFQKFLEKFHVDWKLIFDYLKDNLYYKILEELAKIPGFKNLAMEKLQAI